MTAKKSPHFHSPIGRQEIHRQVDYGGLLGGLAVCRQTRRHSRAKPDLMKESGYDDDTVEGMSV